MEDAAVSPASSTGLSAVFLCVPNNTDGLYKGGIGNTFTFTFTVPAGTTQQVVNVYVVEAMYPVAR